MHATSPFAKYLKETEAEEAVQRMAESNFNKGLPTDIAIEQPSSRERLMHRTADHDMGEKVRIVAPSPESITVTEIIALKGELDALKAVVSAQTQAITLLCKRVDDLR